MIFIPLSFLGIKELEASITITWTLNVVSVIQFTYTVRTDKKAGRLLNVVFFPNHTLWNILFPTHECFSGKPKFKE